MTSSASISCDSLRGRSTVVYSLDGMGTYLFRLQSLTYMVTYAACTTDLPASSMPSGTRRLTLGDGVRALSDQITYKLSYPIEGRSQEGELLSRFVGSFGVADIESNNVCNSERPHKAGK